LLAVPFDVFPDRLANNVSSRAVLFLSNLLKLLHVLSVQEYVRPFQHCGHSSKGVYVVSMTIDIEKPSGTLKWLRQSRGKKGESSMEPFSTQNIKLNRPAQPGKEKVN
jgi:hypothetical protein